MKLSGTWLVIGAGLNVARLRLQSFGAFDASALRPLNEDAMRTYEMHVDAVEVIFQAVRRLLITNLFGRPPYPARPSRVTTFRCMEAVEEMEGILYVLKAMKAM